MSSTDSMIKSVKQNIAMMRSRKNQQFKKPFSKGIFSKSIDTKYKFKKISSFELKKIKLEIQQKAKSQKRKLLVLTILFTIITFIGIYYFFDIATR